MITTYPRSFTPVPSVRLSRLFGLMSLLMCLLLSLVQPVAVRLNLPFPTTAEPALPYAQADRNFFIENRGQFASELAAVMLAREAQLGVGHDGRLHLKVNDFPPLTLQFVSEGYTPTPQVVLTGPLATRVSFLTGNDPSRWQTKVPVWTEVQLKGVVPQLTLALTVAEGRLRIRALPTGQPDLTRIRLVIEGATVVGVGSVGVEVQVGERYLSLPLLEFAGGNERLHQVRPTMIGAYSVGVPIALTEMIGVHWPTLSSSSAAHLLAASTFLGGPGGSSANDQATALKVDGQGNILMAGWTDSSGFPTTAGAYDETHNGGLYDAFVAKLSSDLRTLQAATVLGGASFDYASALALDGQGNVVVAGETRSTDFPTTAGAYDATHNGPSDAFVAKLSSDLRTLQAATFLGGTSFDNASALALDGQGNVVVAGGTGSTDFPTTAGAYDATHNGFSDAFVARLSSDLRTLSAATFLGGSSSDEATALALDGQGNVVVAGRTGSTDFPTTAGAYDATHNDEYDTFVARLSSDLRTLPAATFLGGSDDDYASALALDGQGNVVVAGGTKSTDFPTTAGAYDATHNGGFYDAFVAKLSSDLRTLSAATFLGGTGLDSATALALDGQGNVVVAGWAKSTDFPTTAGAYDPTYNGFYDAFVAKLSSDLRTLSAATFLGGSDDDSARALALDGQGNVVVAGWTRSTDFPTTAGAYDPTYNGFSDVFVARLSSDLGTLLAATFLGGRVGYDSARALVLDGQGNVVVAGETASSDFPTTAGAYDATHNGGFYDAFVARLSSDLGTLQAATFLGGINSDSASALALDGQGNVVVAGETRSTDFPTTTGAYDETYNGGSDAFVARLSSDLGTLQAATFLGGSDVDIATALVFDGQGNVVVAGRTDSSDFPITAGAYDETHNDEYDAFVARLSSDLGTLQAATFLGGTSSDYARALALDGQGNVVVAGETGSSDFPTTVGAYDATRNGPSDAFVASFTVRFGIYLPLVLR